MPAIDASSTDTGPQPAVGDRSTLLEHAVDLDVGDVPQPAVHLVGDDRLGDRLADHRVLGGFLRHGPAPGEQRVAELLVPVERVLEVLAADQLPVAHRPRVAGHRDDAVPHAELLHGHGELLCRALEQEPARLRRGVAQRDPAPLHPGAAGRAALVAGERRVAHHHLHAGEGHVQLLGHDLGDGDVDTLAHVHLAEERGDSAVGQHGDPRIELVGCEGRLAAHGATRLPERRVDPAGHHEADHQGAADFQEVTP
jgi:hypothetical protein